MSSLSVSIQYLKGVGSKRAKTLSKLDVYSIEDLLYYFPRRYEDRTRLNKISQCNAGEDVTIEAEVLATGEKQSWKRKNFRFFDVAFGDQTGVIFAVWFNQPYVKEYFKPGRKFILHGKPEIYKDRLQLANPEFELVDSQGIDSLNSGRIVPVYSITEGVTQRFIRKIVKSALDEYIPKITDPLPYNIRAKFKLLNLAQSLINIHFPQSAQMQSEAYRRLSFEEFFIYQIPILFRKLRRKEQKAISHSIDGPIFKSLLSQLPFELTSSQAEVMENIKKDMASSFAMQRLLQGEVGSGKTIVAILSACICFDSGYQAVFMVPTEILSRQHYEIISQLFSLIGRKTGKKIKIALLTGNINKKEKARLYQKINSGEVQFIVGTHALLQEDLRYNNLGLVIIDEQHKFGVAQRALLKKKAGDPDLLIMTATPIPRTLALTLYGDLDVSVIKELPKGRLPIKTFGYQKGQIEEIYDFVRDVLKKRQQVYFICPLIEDSEVLDLEAAEKICQEYKQNIFKDFRVGLVHGGLRTEENREVMGHFRESAIDILVATSILEVGIDVPNATCMVVLDAQRFGLSQLHQLRGRIGRGSKESYFIVVSEAKTEEAKRRIEAIIEISDGFRIAEEDLKIRGPGEYFGRRQHGLSALKIGDPLSQLHLLKNARDQAMGLLKDDPAFSKRQNQELLLRLKDTFAGFPYLEFTA